MEAVEIIHTWAFAFLGAAVLVVAFLVNRFAPHKRPRIRLALLLYVLFVITAGTSELMELARSPRIESWAEHLHLFEDLFSAFTMVNIVSLAIFDVALPALGLSLVAITGDLVVGFAYIFAALGVLKASGVTASSVLTTSAVVSGVIALSLQTTLGNILGGVALQLDGSVHVGDWIQLPDGQQGRVIAIRWRHTVVETRNWDTIIVPNANLLAQNIVILGKRFGKPLRAGIPLARPAQTLFIAPEEDDVAAAERRKERRIRAIEHLELFHALTPEEHDFVAEHLRYAPFAAGETVTPRRSRSLALHPVRGQGRDPTTHGGRTIAALADARPHSGGWVAHEDRGDD